MAVFLRAEAFGDLRPRWTIASATVIRSRMQVRPPQPQTKEVAAISPAKRSLIDAALDFIASKALSKLSIRRLADAGRGRHVKRG